jgi:hypothetical protein
MYCNRTLCPCEEGGSESVTAAGTPCRQELGTLGVVKVIKRERNKVGRNAEKTQSGGESRSCTLNRRVCRQRQDGVLCFSLNILGSQLFDH